VVDTSVRAVASKIAEIQRDVQRGILRKQKEFDDRYNLAKEPGATRKGEWDVSGSWEVYSSSMDENSRRGENETYTLEIGTTDPIESGAVEMYASFDFISLRDNAVHEPRRPRPRLQECRF